jgi:hypothetical protein
MRFFERLSSLDDERRARIARAGIAFALIAPVAYLVQHLVFRSNDPRAMAHVLTTPFYWRVAASLWWGGLAAVAAYTVRSERWSRRAGLAALGVALGYAVLAWVLP